MEERKSKRIGIEAWSQTSINSFYNMLCTYCPNGMKNACDGTPLEKGKAWKKRCLFYLDGKCTQPHIAKSRYYAENAARRKKMKGEK